MTTNFTIISGSTVPPTYRWDDGIPFNTSSLTTRAFSNTNYISGYAPGLKVRFANNSIATDSTDIEPVFIDFTWNFGDYYNDSGNIIALSCVVPVEHIYIMPGKYTVTLTHTETIKVTTTDAIEGLCLDKYELNWYWSNLESTQVDSKTWNETRCISPFAKWWNSELTCLQKHCKQWSWEKLNSTETENRVRWSETVNGGQFEKRWFYEANDTVCAIPDVVTTTSTDQQVVTKQFIIDVKEIPPVAALHSVTQPITGINPFTVRLSPKLCKTGSFPIDRIDWDFGDGSPIKSVARQGNNNNDNELIYNTTYYNDNLDPRNYDVVHTYNRDLNTYPLFYPSITAYSANTSTFDTCSLTIGPILLPNSGIKNINFVKNKNTINGTLYTAIYNNTCTFFTNITSDKKENTISTKPFNRLQNSFGLTTTYTGNGGFGYPQPITIKCP